MSRSRVLRGVGALVASAVLVLSGSLTAQAASPTVTVTGAYGDCPVQLWSDGTLEFTCSVLDNTSGKGWSGNISDAGGSLNSKYEGNITRVKSGQITVKGPLQGLFWARQI